MPRQRMDLSYYKDRRKMQLEETLVITTLPLKENSTQSPQTEPLTQPLPS